MVATFRDRKSREGTGATARGPDQGREKRIALGSIVAKPEYSRALAPDFDAAVKARGNIIER
jgi:hypothetical protein